MSNRRRSATRCWSGWWRVWGCSSPRNHSGSTRDSGASNAHSNGNPMCSPKRRFCITRVRSSYDEKGHTTFLGRPCGLRIDSSPRQPKGHSTFCSLKKSGSPFMMHITWPHRRESDPDAEQAWKVPF
ncbi:hypothetical protein FGO68_gene9781 [Halteria grandinella]|uniref:Uncharacterized protein n=1 Tax=Halteria grandinella TaxID=5974 RepID=A0A8J8NAC2_HALGN|nr:hypothetical protein FGO68_gene9781 [Halteria grandinella]